LTLNRKSNWQNLENNITSAQELVEKGLIAPEKAKSIQAIIDEYPMSITHYYLGLIKENNDSDPIYKMAVASLNEASQTGRLDTSGEAENTVVDGIQHKYPNTALILSTNICAMYCRHCFRKRLVGQTEEEILTFTDRALDYIEANEEIDNVLISGGDSLMNNNKVIERYLHRLTKNPNIKFIRFGSRVPVVFPQRIYEDEELVELFKKYGKKKKIFVVTQFNHANEFTEESLQAINLLLEAGVPILNQTVLLAGVNDTPEALHELFNKLTEHGISPYYLFQCRPVKGVQNYFAVPLVQATKIVDQARSMLSGVAKRFRYCMSHVRGKIEILGTTKDSRLILKQHQSKDMQEINQIFTVEINDDSCWLPDEIESAPL